MLLDPVWTSPKPKSLGLNKIHSLWLQLNCSSGDAQINNIFMSHLVMVLVISRKPLSIRYRPFWQAWQVTVTADEEEKQQQEETGGVTGCFCEVLSCYRKTLSFCLPPLVSRWLIAEAILIVHERFPGSFLPSGMDPIHVKVYACRAFCAACCMCTGVYVPVCESWREKGKIKVFHSSKRWPKYR